MYVCVCVCVCVRTRVHACVRECVRDVFAIILYDNSILPRLIMIIIKRIILYFIQIRHIDDFPSTVIRLVLIKSHVSLLIDTSTDTIFVLPLHLLKALFSMS